MTSNQLTETETHCELTLESSCLPYTNPAQSRQSCPVVGWLAQREPGRPSRFAFSILLSEWGRKVIAWNTLIKAELSLYGRQSKLGKILITCLLMVSPGWVSNCLNDWPSAETTFSLQFGLQRTLKRAQRPWSLEISEGLVTFAHRATCMVLQRVTSVVAGRDFLWAHLLISRKAPSTSPHQGISALGAVGQLLQRKCFLQNASPVDASQLANCQDNRF